jgi:hypothetical protein
MMRSSIVRVWARSISGSWEVGSVDGEVKWEVG